MVWSISWWVDGPSQNLPTFICTSRIPLWFSVILQMVRRFHRESLSVSLTAARSLSMLMETVRWIYSILELVFLLQKLQMSTCKLALQEFFGRETTLAFQVVCRRPADPMLTLR